MPSDRPKVVTYTSSTIYERLKQYQREKGVASISAAVNQVLVEFFKQMDSKETAPTENEALTSINHELAALRQQVEHLVEIVQTLQHHDNPEGDSD